jgi:hypothetical protein
VHATKEETASIKILSDDTHFKSCRSICSNVEIWKLDIIKELLHMRWVQNISDTKPWSIRASHEVGKSLSDLDCIFFSNSQFQFLYMTFLHITLLIWHISLSGAVTWIYRNQKILFITRRIVFLAVIIKSLELDNTHEK